MGILIVSRETLFADAEIPENSIQQFVQIHAPRDTSDGSESEPDLFGRQFRLWRIAEFCQALDGFLQRMAVASPRKNWRFAAGDAGSGFGGKHVHQLRQALAGL